MILLKVSLLGEKTGSGQNEIIKEFTETFPSNTLNITPKVFIDKYPELKGKKIYGFNAYINCDNSIISVSNFEYFTLAAFIDTLPSICLLKVKNIGDFFRLNSFNIGRFDIEKSNVLLVDSEIQELNVGIETLFG